MANISIATDRIRFELVSEEKTLERKEHPRENKLKTTENNSNKRNKMQLKLSNRRVFIVVLLVTTIVAFVGPLDANKPIIDENLNNRTNPRSESVVIVERANKSLSANELETAPSITSVHHQVWTSSSSGSLDELSPEIISKLRQDVPFLAAYALRPRLVGGVSAVPTMPPLAANYEPSATGSQASVNGLDTAASSPRSARQASSSQPVPSALGDFSEFNVETSSLSKSEHHHKRKTSLKRQPKGDSEYAHNNRYVKPTLASKFVVQKSAKRAVKRTASKDQRKRKQLRISRRTSNSQSHGRLARTAKRRGKLVQTSGEPAIKWPEIVDNELASVDTKGGSAGAKGGSRGTRRPFYSKSQPTNNAGREEDHIDGVKGADSGVETNKTAEPVNPLGENGLGDEADQADSDIELDDEPHGGLERVGDDDVEEDGDTVLVEPKSDGVDDDPELPEEDDGTGSVESEREEPTSDSNSGTSGAADRDQPAQTDSRGKRIGRERPNNQRPPTEFSSSGQDGGSTNGQAAGGGIGTTIGSGNTNGGPSKESPGVEFANESGDDNGDDDDGRNEDASREGTKRARGASGTTAGGSFGSGTSEGTFGNRNEGTGSSSSDKGRSPGADDGDDLDYRDEIEQDGRRTGKNGGDHSGTSTSRAPLDEHSSVEGSKGAGATMTSKTSQMIPKSFSTSNQDCDSSDDDHEDGSYKAHDERYHDKHHQTIDWLRGSIPGEPGADYPILDRVSNRTNFKCSEHKFPGYYADVETSCQIFHICQADGRQDSFLCPNGTIFSQKTLVCVWWNGFDCEEPRTMLIDALELIETEFLNDAMKNQQADAPKFYHFNELLYKSSSARDSPQSAALPASSGSLRPLDDESFMKSIKSRSMSDEADAVDEQDASIESLIQAMRGKNRNDEALGIDSAERKRSHSASDSTAADEATIQRKSTTDNDGDSAEASPSRLRSKDKIPRRKRRASARQAPPRLKSRRVSRNSRRRKLRHNIKPKRRA